MRKLILTILIVGPWVSILAQDGIYLSPALVAAGATGREPDGSTVTLSRWRLTNIPVITLSGDYPGAEEDLINDGPDEGWKVALYPNPVDENLHIEFKLDGTSDFVIKLTDLSGRVLMIREAGNTLPGDIIELDMSGYASTLYLIHISMPDQKSGRVYRIQKI
jgi:hypothetical protein